MTTDKPPTIAQLQRRIARLEAQVQAALQLNLRISNTGFDIVMENADMRLKLQQIAQLTGAEC